MKITNNSLLFLFFLFSISIFSQEEKRLALVIGNANYEKGELKNPVNDARLIKSTLDSLDFDVILATDLDKGEFMNKVVEFGNKRGDYDVGFVYYAGHGVQINGENYLLPTNQNFDEEWKIEEYAINVNRIMKYLTAVSNQVNILILDACRNNPWEGIFRSASGGDQGGLAKMSAPTGSLIAFSTGPGRVAADGDGEHSIYTTSLSKNMLKEDTSIDQIFRNVRAEVLAETDEKQRPVEETQLTGQTFYLNPSNFNDELNEIETVVEEEISEKYLSSQSRLEEVIKRYPRNTQANFLMGRIYNLMEKYDEAIEHFNAIDSFIEDKSKLNTYIGSSYKMKGENTKAEKYYRSAIELDSIEDNFYYRGDFYKEIGEYNKALLDYSKAIDLDPNDMRYLFARALVYDDLEENEKGISDLLRIIELDKDKAYRKEKGSVYNNLAVHYGRLGKHDEELEYYTKEIDLDPEDYLAYRNRAYAYANNLNDNEKALIDFNKSIELDSIGENFYYRGDFYKDIEQYDQALLDYSKAIDLDPNDMRYLFARALVYDDLEKNDKAISDLLRIIELDKDEDQLFIKEYGVYNNLAVASQNMGNYDKSIEYYTKEIELAPDDYLAYLNRAEAYGYFFNDKEKALNDYNKAIELNPKGLIFYNKAGFLHEIGESEKALMDINRAIELKPKSIIYLDLRFRIHYNLNEIEKTIADLLRIVELDTDLSAAKNGINNNLGFIYREIEKYDKALEYFTKDINLRPYQDLAYTNRALLYAYNLNENEKALIDFNKAIELNPVANNFYLRGYFYSEIGEYNNALLDYNKAIELDPDDMDKSEKAGVLLELGKTDEALKVYNDITIFYKKDLDKYREGLIFNYKHISNVYFKYISDYSKALEYTNKAIKLYLELDERDLVGESEALSLRGNIYLAKGKTEKALMDFNKAVELSPEETNFYYTLANFYIKTNDNKSAIKTVDKVIKMDRHDPQGYFQEALIYIKENNYVKAMSLISYSILKLEDSEIENEGYYIEDIDGKKRISLADLYLYRAKISKKLGDVSFACEDIETALSKSKTEDEKEKIEKRISLECN